MTNQIRIQSFLTAILAVSVQVFLCWIIEDPIEILFYLTLAITPFALAKACLDETTPDIIRHARLGGPDYIRVYPEKRLSIIWCLLGYAVAMSALFMYIHFTVK